MVIAKIEAKNAKFRNEIAFGSKCNCGSSNCNCGSQRVENDIYKDLNAKMKKAISNN